MDKSLSFYTELLGFERYYEFTFAQGMVKGMKVNFVRGGSCIVMLAKPADLSWIQEPGNTNGDHFAIEVQGLDQLVDSLRGAGYMFEEEEPIATKDFFPNGRRTIHFKGPSGERIGLVEYGCKQE
ncbi:MAG: hypothetical protein F7B06_07540 [Opitutae bacterium]|nr:hypothetical protein [Opitutae bacterium]